MAWGKEWDHSAFREELTPEASAKLDAQLHRLDAENLQSAVANWKCACLFLAMLAAIGWMV